jgi:hypothetical protein
MAKTTNQIPEIHETTDYDQFKAIIGNRAIFQPHLNRMIEDLQEHNFLPTTPIKVNQRMEVIDGQHRLLAAKHLGLPIYYIIEDEGDLTTVQKTNSRQRQWTIVDFLESYMATGKKDYIRLAEFCEEYNTSIATAIELLSGRMSGRSSLEDFKNGKFAITDYERAERVASLLNEIRRFSPDKVWTHRVFVRTLVLLDKEGKIDPKEITKQLEKHQLAVTRRPSLKGYLLELEDIVNFDKNRQDYVALA